MPKVSDNIKHLKEWYQKARASGMELNFALSLGKKDDGMMIFVDKRKSPTKLLLDAKDEGETNKFAYGTMRIQKDEVFLTCVKKPPSGLEKRVRNYLKFIKMPGAPSRVILTGDDGVQQKPQANESQSGGDQPDGTNKDRARWEAGLAKLGPPTMARIKAGDATAPVLTKMMKQARQLADKGQYQQANVLLQRISKVLKASVKTAGAPKTQGSKSAAPPKADPGAAKAFQTQRAKVLPLLSAAQKGKSPRAKAAQTAMKSALASAKAKDFDTGLTRLHQVERLLSQSDDQFAALRQRLAVTAKTLKQSDLSKAEANRLAKAVTRANAVLKKGDADNCATLLDKIDQILASQAALA